MRRKGIILGAAAVFLCIQGGPQLAVSAQEDSENGTEPLVEPALEPAEMRPPPGSGSIGPEEEAPASGDAGPPPEKEAAAPAAPAAPAGAVPLSSDIYPADRKYRGREDIPPLTAEEAKGEAYVFLGAAPNEPVLLYRVNRLPPFLPIGITERAGEYQVYAGPLNRVERSFVQQRRDYLWKL